MGGFQSKEKKKLLFLGLDNAGKTSILNKLTNGSIHTVSPTRGYNITQTAFEGIEFSIWDVGGQQSLRNQWPNYFEKVAGIIWVIDSADKARMFETGLELAALLENDKINGIPLLIFANKQDLVTAMNADEITDELELHSIRNRDWQIQNCSALDGSGIEDGLHWLSQAIH